MVVVLVPWWLLETDGDFGSIKCSLNGLASKLISVE